MDYDYEKIKGIEVLSFDHVELIRNRLGKNTFIDVGTLAVVFFPELNRFVLFLGDWEYALLKRIPIVASSRTDMKSRMYNLPTYTGFYNLKFSKIMYPEAIQNFETILSHYSKFSYYDEEAPVRHVEASPDASLIEEEAQPEIPISQASTATKKSTEMLMSDDAKPGKLKGAQRIKKGFAKMADKLRGGSRHQANNVYLTQVLDISSLAATNAEFAPVEYFGRKEVELGIIKSKDMAMKMRFGVSPNEIQFINMGELKESMQMIMISENDITAISQGEAEILQAIEKERELQEYERQQQEVHRSREIELIEKERELREMMRQKIEEHKLTEIMQTIQRFQVELDRRDDMILDQARQREEERAAFERREQTLIAEIEQRLEELRAKERLTEEERIEFSKREQELLQIRARREAEKAEVELRGRDLMEQVKTREMSLQERERQLELSTVKFREMEQDLKMRRAGLNELKSKAVLTAEERAEIKKREEELERLIALKESERLALERQGIDMEANAEMFKAELLERQLLTEAERIALVEKEKEIEAEAERVLADLRAKESLTEEERLEIEKRQKELKRIASLREAERMEFLRKRKDLEIEAARREAALREKAKLTENERAALERIKSQIEKETEMQEVQQRQLQEERNRLLEEAERRAAEIQRRAELTEAERLEIYRKEEELQKEIEAKLAALRLKEILTEEDRVELMEQERTLTSLKEFKEVEIKTMGVQFEKIRRQEERLLEQNNQMLQKEKAMHDELKEMQHELA